MPPPAAETAAQATTARPAKKSPSSPLTTEDLHEHIRFLLQENAELRERIAEFRNLVTTGLLNAGQRLVVVEQQVLVANQQVLVEQQYNVLLRERVSDVEEEAEVYRREVVRLEQRLEDLMLSKQQLSRDADGDEEN
jgi:hypothetical protein